MRLIAKTRQGARVRKVYDIAQTPYQGLLKSGALGEASQAELAALYRGLNPVQLLALINEHLKKLWQLAERQAIGNRINKATRTVSVTV